MSDRIEPALSAEEWALESLELYPMWEACLRDGRLCVEFDDGAYDHARAEIRQHHRVAGLIALANVALPDDDPRKITRHSVWVIRTLLRDANIDNMHPGALQFRRDAEQLAGALESYLPPEES